MVGEQCSLNIVVPKLLSTRVEDLDFMPRMIPAPLKLKKQIHDALCLKVIASRYLKRDPPMKELACTAYIVPVLELVIASL